MLSRGPSRHRREFHYFEIAAGSSVKSAWSWFATCGKTSRPTPARSSRPSPTTLADVGGYLDRSRHASAGTENKLRRGEAGHDHRDAHVQDQAGCRTKFLEVFRNRPMPAHAEIGLFLSLEDPDTFFLCVASRTWPYAGR
jgi:hypothetical protein